MVKTKMNESFFAPRNISVFGGACFTTVRLTISATKPKEYWSITGTPTPRPFSVVKEDGVVLSDNSSANFLNDLFASVPKTRQIFLNLMKEVIPPGKPLSQKLQVLTQSSII